MLTTVNTGNGMSVVKNHFGGVTFGYQVHDLSDKLNPLRATYDTMGEANDHIGHVLVAPVIETKANKDYSKAPKTAKGGSKKKK